MLADSVLTIVMPAHNEQDYLASAVERVLAGLRPRGGDFEVLIIENGSTDDTASVAADLATEHPEVRDIRLPGADYGAALRRGLLEAAEWAAVFDVDYVDLGFLERAQSAVDDVAAAIVVGSKRGPGAEDHRSAARRLITAGFTGVLRVGFGLKVSDTHGIKLVHLPSVRELVESTRHDGEIFDTELILRAERAGLEVRELPVTVADQRPPRSSILRRIPRSLLALARLRASLWVEQLDRHHRLRRPTG